MSIVEGRGAIAGAPAPATGYAPDRYISHHHRPLAGAPAQLFEGIYICIYI